ncbi:MAG: PilN domain-containing protein [Deltaproteobacteria bacterium]|nr:PilN domain-containing protein [Deltaproteobacteria bacterium]
MNLNNLSLLTKDYFFGSPGSTLTGRDIIGLHLEKEKLHYVCLTRARGGWIPARPGPALEPLGSVEEPAPWSLKQFLEWLTVFPLVEGASAPRKLAVYLTLPRNCFSARDLQLPPMPMEDALVSVENSLPVCCHLPIEEIYYDIHLCRTIQGNINALIVYAARRDMDEYLDIFRETGHMDSLRGIFPVSFGIGAWLNIQRYPMPIGLILPQDSAYELAVFQKKGCLFSGTWPLSEGTEEGDLLAAAAKSKFQGLGENIFYLHNGGTPALPSPSPNRLDQLPLVAENPGMAAVAPAISGQQEISIDGTPPRLKTFQTVRLAVPLVLILILTIFLMTWNVKWGISSHQEDINILKAEIHELKKKLEPIEQNRTTFREAGRILEDTREFMKTKPRLFSHINEVARCLPGDTWFSHFDFKNRVMTLKGESPDALKVIEALRTSSMFGQVTLKGSVNRNKTGAERFSLTIKLKNNEADK